jgi:hypothetical protein
MPDQRITAHLKLGDLPAGSLHRLYIKLCANDIGYEVGLPERLGTSLILVALVAFLEVPLLLRLN